MPETPTTARTRDLPVTGMHCAGCASGVERILKHADGIEAASVNIGTHRLAVTGSLGLDAMAKALTKGGFDLGTRTTLLHGLGADAAEAIRAEDGVRSVSPVEDALEVLHVDAPEVLERLREHLGAHGSAETEADPEAARMAAESSQPATVST